MIVNRNQHGVTIIYHAAHGLLAGKIANRLRQDLRFEPWFDFLIAVSEHDDRQLDFNEKSYLSDSGIPINFSEEKKYVVDIMRRMQRVITTANGKSSFVRIMISSHLEFLYGSFRSKSKRIKDFLNREKSVRERTLTIYNMNSASLSHAYQFLRFCDRLSLILSMGKAPNNGRTLEINTSINNEAYFIKRTSKTKLNIKPWPFNTNEFTLSIEARVLEKACFDSEAQFQNEIQNKSPILKSWIISKNG